MKNIQEQLHDKIEQLQEENERLKEENRILKNELDKWIEFGDKTEKALEAK